MSVYVIIPVYNEAEMIGSVVDSVIRKFPNVVCVNDGSKDGTQAALLDTKARVVRHPINLGQGAALQTGVDYALQDSKARYFVTFDADGQHRLEDVEKMLTHLKKNDLDIVLGSRFLGKVENITLMKKIVLKLAVRFSNRTSGLKLTDTHNGLRVFNRHVAENLNITMNDFAHASEILERVSEKAFKYDEVPVTIRYTDYSRSKGQSIYNAINIAFDVLLRKIYK